MTMRTHKDFGPRLCEVDTTDGKVLVPVTVKRSRRLRYIRVTVNESMEVTLKIPWRVSEKVAMEFFQSQGNWVGRMLKNKPRRLSLLEYLQKKPWLSVNGRKVELVCEFTRGQTRIDCEHTGRQVRLKFDPRQPRDPQILQLLKGYAKHTLLERTRCLAEMVGVQVNRISVRDQLTVWGSCSDRGTVSLNWRLILLPFQLQDYLIFHELAHLTHLDHSPEYWNHLLRYDHDTRKHDKQIAHSFSHIMALGRSDAC